MQSILPSSSSLTSPSLFTPDVAWATVTVKHALLIPTQPTPLISHNGHAQPDRAPKPLVKPTHSLPFHLRLHGEAALDEWYTAPIAETHTEGSGLGGRAVQSQITKCDKDHRGISRGLEKDDSATQTRNLRRASGSNHGDGKEMAHNFGLAS